MSRRVRWVQWSADAAPRAQARATPPLAPSWLACTRSPRPCRRAASSTVRGFLDVEGAGLAEHVAPSSRPGRGRDHGLGQQPHVAVAVAGELGRDQMGPEEGGFGREGRGDLQVDGLVLGSEAVAGLDLDGGGARCPGLADQAPGAGLQVRRGRGPGGRHGLEDPAGLVGAPGHPQGELLGPVAGEDQVSVGVDESRHHAAAVEVHHGVDVERGRRCGSGEGDPIPLDDQRRVRHRHRGCRGRGRRRR